MAKEAAETRSTGEPIPRDQKFFEWLESLFFDDGAQSPERLEVRVVSGKDHERLGPIVKQYTFAPPAANEAALKASIGKQRPKNKEEVVRLSNDMFFRMQRDCDESKKPHTYAVLASHVSRDVDPGGYYERWLKRCTPQNVHSKDGDFNEDEEPKSMQERYGLQALEHDERMFELYGKMVEGIVDRYDRVSARDQDEIEKLRHRLAEKEDMLEKALSLKEERDANREWRSVGTRSAEKALNLAIDMAPTAINRLAGKSVFATKDTPESIALRNFLREKKDGGLLTPEQIVKAFGVYEDEPPHKLIEQGVLSFEQAKVLFDVAATRSPGDDVDKLLPGGAHEITQAQLMRLQTECGFSMEQIGPVMALFGERYTRKVAAAKP